MTDGVPAPNHFSQEDIQSLEQTVEQYIDGGVERNAIVAALASSIAAICVAGKLKPDSSYILPYLEQLDAHDKELADAEARGQGPDLSGSQVEDSDDEDYRPPRGSKRSLDSRLTSPEPDHDVNEDLHVAKRSRIDPTKFTWRSQEHEFLTSIVLTAEHQNVRQQVENYSLDPKEALRDLLNSFGNPAISETQWKDVLLDRYVEFDDILADSFTIEAEESQQLLLGNTTLEIKKPKVVSKISSQGDWLNAFMSFEDAVNFAFSGRSEELRTYSRHITNLFRSTHTSLHHRIINYDRAVRIFVGRRRDVLLSEISKFDHIRSAHLVDGGIGVTHLQQFSSTSQSKPRPSGNTKPRPRRSGEVCRNHNNGRCKMGPDCNYRHVCSSCQASNHTAPNCLEKTGR
jgi:hypothetical protein